MTTTGSPRAGDPVSRVQQRPGPSGPARPRGLHALAVAAVSIVTALVTTWPLAGSLTTAVPMGTEREATVPLLNIWQLWWMADRLVSGMRGYLDAPIFFPNEGVTTYTETMPLVGLLVAPLWAVELPPALIYNAALLALLSLNGVFAYRLARALSLPHVTGLLTAVLAVQLPFAVKVLGVLPSVAFFGMFWTLDGLVRFAKGGSARWWLWALAGFAVTALTWQQNALFFAPIAAGAGFLALHQQRPDRRTLFRLAAATAAVGAVLLLTALPAIRVHGDAGFERPEQVVRALSAKPGDFLTRPVATAVGLPRADPRDTAGLFPGEVVLTMAVLGLITSGRRGSRHRGWVLLFAGGALAGVVMALGLNVAIGGWRPFASLRAIPAFAEIRSPFRAAAIFQVCLVPLAALGLSAVPRLMKRGATVATFAMVAIVAVSVVENASTKSLAVVPETPRTAWSEWLGEQPEGTVVAHVPFPAGFTAADFEIEGWRMFAQIDHQQPLVNGYSGYFPVARGESGDVEQAYLRFVATMRESFPDEFLLCVLVKSLGADVLVVDKAWLQTNEGALDEFADFLRPGFTDAEVTAYRVVVPAGRCRPAEREGTA